MLVAAATEVSHRLGLGSTDLTSMGSVRMTQRVTSLTCRMT